jgi:DUF4097 and DUF4098 domain-containing protein YvlB
MRSLFALPAALGAAFLLAPPAPAQMRDNQTKELECRESGGNARKRVCQMKEETLAAAPRLDVSAAPNGGISVKGWLQAKILVRARVEAWGETEAEARQTMEQVKLSTAGGKVRADGPKSATGRQGWSVSYEVFVPQRTDLELDTVNGGIHVTDVKGALNFETVNGGLQLARVGGRVKGETTNGGVNVDLEGSAFDGESLDVHTTNGGVNVKVPASYSARFQAATTHGGLSSDLPGAKVTGDWVGKSLESTAGSGGALIRVKTTNGGVRIQRKG